MWSECALSCLLMRDAPYKCYSLLLFSISVTTAKSMSKHNSLTYFVPKVLLDTFDISYFALFCVANITRSKVDILSFRLNMMQKMRQEG